MQVPYSQELAALAGLDTPIAGLGAGLGAGLASIQDKDLQDLQDLSPNIFEDGEIDREKDETGQEAQKEVEKGEVTPASPASPVNPLSSKVLSPAPSPCKLPVKSPPCPNERLANRLVDELLDAKATGDEEKEEKVTKEVEGSHPQVRGFFRKALNGITTTPQPEPKQRRPLEVGDRVVVVKPRDRAEGVKGEVVKITNYPTYTGLRVRFDKEVAFVREDEFQNGDLMYLPEK
ncbi:hypothetical protein QUA81_24545 [Microcoleus sp. F6_B4]